MRLSEEQLQRLAAALVKVLVTSGRALLKADQEVVLARTVAILRQELAGDLDLDREAQKLLDAHLKQAPPGVDKAKLLQMIKKRLADEKGIPL